jgi:thioredoxin reductase
MQNREWDAVVIGGGAAGLSAAQMLGRARRRTLVIDEGSPRNRFAAHMHGVLGHDGIEPQALLARGRDELDRYGVHVEKGAVADIRDEGAVLRLTRVDGTVDTARAVIATGCGRAVAGSTSCGATACCTARTATASRSPALGWACSQRRR